MCNSRRESSKMSWGDFKEEEEEKKKKNRRVGGGKRFLDSLPSIDKDLCEDLFCRKFKAEVSEAIRGSRKSELTFFEKYFKYSTTTDTYIHTQKYTCSSIYTRIM